MRVVRLPSLMLPWRGGGAWLEPSDSFLASAGVESAVERGRGCVQPVGLRGAKHLVNTETGELTKVYASADELEGHTYVKCGNRRLDDAMRDADVVPMWSRADPTLFDSDGQESENGR